MSLELCKCSEQRSARRDKAAQPFQRIVGAWEVSPRPLKKLKLVRGSANEARKGGKFPSGTHAVVAGGGIWQDGSVCKLNDESCIVVDAGYTAQTISVAQQRHECEVEGTSPEGEVAAVEGVRGSNQVPESGMEAAKRRKQRT